MEKIPNKLSQDILSIYTDYKSDFTDEYLCILGVQVKDISYIPEGMIGRTFPAENFKKFIAKGSIPQSVAQTWMDIWEMDAELHRKYTYDFEVYVNKSQNGEDAEVEIYIAVH